MIASGMPVEAAPTVLHRQLPSNWSQSSSLAISEDARQSNTQAQLAAAHFSARPTLVLLIAQSDDISYEHVALMPGRTVKTRYRYIGRLPAREFPDID
jgi:hypothetical protein